MITFGRQAAGRRGWR